LLTNISHFPWENASIPKNQPVENLCGFFSNNENQLFSPGYKAPFKCSTGKTIQEILLGFDWHSFKPENLT